MSDTYAQQLADRLNPSRDFTYRNEWDAMPRHLRGILVDKMWTIFLDNVHASWRELYDFPKHAECQFCGAIAPEGQEVNHAPNPGVRVARLARRGDHWLCNECWMRGIER